MGARPQDDKADNELGQGFHKGTGHTKSNDSAVYSTSRRCEKERYPSHFARMVETVRVIRDFPRGRNSAVTIAGRRRQPRRAAPRFMFNQMVRLSRLAPKSVWIRRRDTPDSRGCSGVFHTSNLVRSRPSTFSSSSSREANDRASIFNTRSRPSWSRLVPFGVNRWWVTRPGP